MSWGPLRTASDRSHHILENGTEAYAERFDEVLSFHDPGLAAVRRGAEAWHIYSNGQAAYGHRFACTFGFYEGLAAVTTKRGWHHIDIRGHAVYAQRYAWCGNYQDGRCSVRDSDGSYFHIDPGGRASCTQRWRYAGDYRDGVAVVQTADGRSTHIDLNGRPLHGRWFIDLDVFHKGFARARDETGWTHVDHSGTPIYTRRFASIEPFYNGQARVERFDGALEIIDPSAATLAELRPARRSEFALLSHDLVGFWGTQTIAAAVSLGIIEALPCSEAAVADRCGLRPDGARRMLHALEELNLAASADAIWQLTERGKFLRADDPLTLAGAALEYAGPLSQSWKQLSDALRTESDWTPPDVFQEVARDNRRRERHHRMLRSYARHDYPAVVEALELAGDERIIDAGGGLGTLASMVLDAYPRVDVTVLDRREVIEMGRLEQGARRGLYWYAGDIFSLWTLQGEAVLLSRVLHDWDDAAASRILARARAALPVGGRLFVIEMILPEHGAAGSLCDLHLLVATGGRERTESEYARLLTDSGFKVSEIRRVVALPAVIIGVAT